MKLALRWIPTEVWVDVFIFPWISRKQLGRIVHRFRNRKFVEILQYCLHERGKRTLSCLDLNKKTLSAEIPRTPMPENIKFFKEISIHHFDTLALDFLHRIRTLFINGVSPSFFGFGSEDDLPKLCTILDHLAPLINGMNSLSFDECAIPIMELYFAPKLAQVKWLAINFESHKERVANEATINFCLNWLISGEQESAEPKFLQLVSIGNLGEGDIRIQQFFEAIQQQFLSAKSASTFGIQFIECSIGDFPIADFHLDNTIGEQLHGKLIEFGHFQILRHQPNAGKALQEWAEETNEKCFEFSVFGLYSKTSIGPIDANAGANDGVMNDAEYDGPSTSKKPKLG